MKKFKNKKTFLIFLLGFYAVIAVFTGVVMYLPYIATEEYYEEEAETSEDEDSYEEESSGDEDSYDEEASGDEDSYDEEASEDEDSYDEEASEDEDSYDEEASEDEDSYDEEASEDEDTYDEEASEDEDTYDEEASEDEDTYDEEASEDEDTYDEEASEDEDTYENGASEDENTADSSVPHTEDTEDGSHDDSVVVPTPISETIVNNIHFSYNGKGKLNIRKEPSKSGNIVGTISTNTKGMILEFVNDEWAKVTYNNKEGYVAYEYIEYTLPEDAVIPSPKPSAMP